MITWMDFVLDDFLGPVLNFEQDGEQVCRASASSEFMDDGRTDTIQETRTGQQPARMVGESLLDPVRFGLDAERVSKVARPRENG